MEFRYCSLKGCPEAFLKDSFFTFIMKCNEFEPVQKYVPNDLIKKEDFLLLLGAKIQHVKLPLDNWISIIKERISISIIKG